MNFNDLVLEKIAARLEELSQGFHDLRKAGKVLRGDVRLHIQPQTSSSSQNFVPGKRQSTPPVAVGADGSLDFHMLAATGVPETTLAQLRSQGTSTTGHQIKNMVYTPGGQFNNHMRDMGGRRNLHMDLSGLDKEQRAQAHRSINTMMMAHETDEFKALKDPNLKVVPGFFGTHATPSVIAREGRNIAELEGVHPDVKYRLQKYFENLRSKDQSTAWIGSHINNYQHGVTSLNDHQLDVLDRIWRRK